MIITDTLVNSSAEATDRAVRPANAPIPPEEVRAQMQAILNSKAFARSPRISRFLNFVVEQTLDGQETKLKEYLLGVEVFGRLDSFDPRIDSIVRVEARRLRYKLEKYYETEGQRDTVHIQFRKGCYVPVFATKRAGDIDGGELADVPFVRPIHNTHAFAQYARGRQCLGQWTADGIAESVSCFTHSSEAEPECASALAGLASAWMFSSMLGFMPARDVVPKAKDAALKALSIAPILSEAMAVTGIASAVYEWEWMEAELKLRKAIHSNPCDGGARLWYSLFLALTGRSEDAIREAGRAQQAQPTSLTAHLAAGLACHLSGAHEEALQQYRLAQDLDGTFFGSYLAMGLLLTDQGMSEQALHMLNRAGQLQPGNPWVIAALAYTHSAAQRTDAAQSALAELKAMADKQYVCPFTQALAYSATGDLDMAFRKLDAAADERSTWLATIQSAPVFHRVRQDSRFDGLMSRMRLA